MKKIISAILLLLSIVSITNKVVFAEENQANKVYNDNLKRDLLVLMLAYPDEIKDIVKDKNGLVYIVTSKEKMILYDDRKEKTLEQKFYNTDLNDTLEQNYPLDMITEVMEVGKDPGRMRCYALLGAMYGDNQSAVEKNLVHKNTYYGSMMFNGVNGAADALQTALNKISKIAENNNIGGFVAPTSGTYNYRVIRDTGQLSPHAFGIAIDLKSDPSDYWKWCTKDKGSARIAKYPEEIVKTFEECGFVWGGKWEHFDILHFEYRPEIILKARYFGDINLDENKEWYEGCVINDDVKEIIDKINNTI